MPLAIRHSEMEALLRLERVQLKEWELDALEILDGAWLRATSKK